mgnify:CR=1 FL=1
MTTTDQRAAVKLAAERLILEHPRHQHCSDDCAEKLQSQDIAVVARALLAALTAENERLTNLLVRRYSNPAGVHYQECRICRALAVLGQELRHHDGCALAAAPASLATGETFTTEDAIRTVLADESLMDGEKVEAIETVLRG